MKKRGESGRGKREEVNLEKEVMREWGEEEEK